MNRLDGQSSLYLQQHADNPVHWWPWCDEALAAAREQNKPILLSIGYAACHWCHVMAHESFEDQATADLMNQHFINIKVDREQRPDLDRLYQTAHQLIVQRPGGWPLTMFLTPDAQLPFFGGTYFPPETRQGMPAFREVLTKVTEFFSADPTEAARQGAAVQAVYAKLDPEQSDSDPLSDLPARALRAHLEQHADAEHGGFGRAPKFPQVPSLLFLLHHWRASANADDPDLEALYLAALAETRMARGGLMDQIGGGFFRYCVDAGWQIPHFEKMLYDNAQLLQLYAESAQATGDTLFGDTAALLVDWLRREMRADDGSFYTAVDADAGGVEGAFYTWTPDEIDALLDPDQATLARDWFNLDAAANFEGRWHLTVTGDADALAEAQQLTGEAFAARIDALRQTLSAARTERTMPAIDCKRLTSQNALMVKALAVAARCMLKPEWQQLAADAMRFIQTELLADGRLSASWQDGRAEFAGYLDDYAFAIDALLELLQNEWRDDWLALAITLSDALLRYFEDEAQGGFYFTAHDHESLLYRQKPITDESMPAGNAIALKVLLRLGHLIGETRFLDAGERLMRFAAGAVHEFPQAHITLIDVLAETREQTEIVILRGDANVCEQWQRDLQRLYAPNRMTFYVPTSADAGLISERPAPIAGARAYICRGTQCLAAIDDWRVLLAELRGR